MAGGHHRCNEHKLGQTLGDGEGQGSLRCYSTRGCKEFDMTGQIQGMTKQIDKDEERFTEILVIKYFTRILVCLVSFTGVYTLLSS